MRGRCYRLSGHDGIQLQREYEQHQGPAPAFRAADHIRRNAEGRIEPDLD